MLKQKFYANGKLLLTGEYLILDGAVGLAVPTRYGQSLTVSENIFPNAIFDSEWFSFDEQDMEWFSCSFDSQNFRHTNESGESVGETLMKILTAARDLGAKIPAALDIETRLSFPRAWGLGTSSTLIYNIANWLKINPFSLLEKTFGGSGYDLACAGASSAILFDRKKGSPNWHEVHFEPPYADQLFFIYLGKKQNSREGIAHYRAKAAKLPPQYFDQISALSEAFLTEKEIKTVEKIILEHENLVADIIELPRAKTLFFADFWGEIKSLGAWGGDFVLATTDRSTAETSEYFYQKGFPTVLSFEEMILKSKNNTI